MSKKTTEVIKCTYCGKNYTRANKSRHRKTAICLAYQKAVQTYNKLLLTENNKIKTLEDLVKKPFTDNKGNTIYLSNMQLNFVNKLTENNMI